ncbi:site-specific DNA-methyltransferase [Helicobacter sp. NHP22-001]|uniref:DNA-methyltransferase n=1 Tax=Helicobacter sp. NHP22-001 TaxID=3040202 RepID=UPI00244D90F5|nr:site-specific DNA-methyltransferase [Helicobacter sp. NHP22-001]GMB96946.1 Type IIS restriction enzyme M2 protein [Helicobacter sp. NHP22-001]
MANQVFFKSSQSMDAVPDRSVALIITSPPYFNIKDYSKNGTQSDKHSTTHTNDLGNIDHYKTYLQELLRVWQECERVLEPNGKLCINVPLLPMLKSAYNTHHNRHIFDLKSDIEHSILEHTRLYLLDLYIWNRTNTTKKLMFGSYPYPTNFYAQNTSEFIIIFVKDGKPKRVKKEYKEASKLTQQEWIEFTKQIWDIPIPNKSDLAFGEHAAIMPELLAYRLVKMFSFVQDIVLDPFAGSGTTLKVAKELGRQYIGYEIYPHYEKVINAKLQQNLLLRCL